MDALLDRFCRYVMVETTAVEQTDDYPSSPGQRTLGNLLAGELRAMGVTDVEVSEHGIVTATVPANVDNAPTIAWIAHMDTSPEACGKNVKPIVHRNYDGGDIVLPGDTSRVIRVAETEGLAELKGKTVITTDGTTLLGADDKSGVTIIMTAVAELMKNTDAPRGPIRVVFTCDEEVGRGTDKVDLSSLEATVGYTLDGEADGIIENETFSADLAVVTITGRNIHPGLATGKMINALRLAGLFLSRMPWQTLSPETTRDRQGFMHPYVLDGGVERASIRIILRSFVAAELADQAKMLQAVADSILAEHPGATVEIDITQQYRNMVEVLAREPRAVDLAAKAFRQIGVDPEFRSIRGGTDGSRLSEMGLPTPNLSAGMHNFHSPLEFACLEQMETAVNMLIELAALWSKERVPS